MLLLLVGVWTIQDSSVETMQCCYCWLVFGQYRTTLWRRCNVVIVGWCLDNTGQLCGDDAMLLLLVGVWTIQDSSVETMQCCYCWLVFGQYRTALWRRCNVVIVGWCLDNTGQLCGDDAMLLLLVGVWTIQDSSVETMQCCYCWLVFGQYRTALWRRCNVVIVGWCLDNTGQLCGDDAMLLLLVGVRTIQNSSVATMQCCYVGWCLDNTGQLCGDDAMLLFLVDITGMARLGKIPTGKAGFDPRSPALEADALPLGHPGGTTMPVFHFSRRCRVQCVQFSLCTREGGERGIDRQVNRQTDR